MPAEMKIWSSNELDSFIYPCNEIRAREIIDYFDASIAANQFSWSLKGNGVPRDDPVVDLQKLHVDVSYLFPSLLSSSFKLIRRAKLMRNSRDEEFSLQYPVYLVSPSVPSSCLLFF